MTISTLVHVVPNVTDNWTLTVHCPCYTIDEGFNYTLNFPLAEHPPWNASITVNFSGLAYTGAFYEGVYILGTSVSVISLL